MAPKKEPNPVSPEQVAECVVLLAQVASRLGPPPRLTAKERIRNLKLRKGGQAVVAAVAALSDRFEVGIPGFPTGAMRERLAQAQELAPLQMQLAMLQKHVDDLIFEAQSECWEGATTHYTALKRLSRRDGDLAAALAPVMAFFAARRPPVKDDAPAGEVTASGGP